MGLLFLCRLADEEIGLRQEKDLLQVQLQAAELGCMAPASLMCGQRAQPLRLLLRSQVTLLPSKLSPAAP